MECVLRAWGQLERGFEVLARCEICFEGMRGSQKGGLRCWHWAKYVLRAWGELQMVFDVLALGEICFEGMGAVQKRVRGVGTV